MGRPRQLSAALERRVAREVLVARGQIPPVSWKKLGRRYGFGRDKLWKLWRAGLAAQKDVCKHLAPGQGRPPRGYKSIMIRVNFHRAAR